MLKILGKQVTVNLSKVWIRWSQKQCCLSCCSVPLQWDAFFILLTLKVSNVINYIICNFCRWRRRGHQWGGDGLNRRQRGSRNPARVRRWQTPVLYILIHTDTYWWSFSFHNRTWDGTCKKNSPFVAAAVLQTALLLISSLSPDLPRQSLKYGHT